MTKVKNITLSLMSLLVLLGGCNMKKTYTKAEIMAGGVIDVDKARASGYVSPQEKLALGTETVEANMNKDVQKKVLANYDTIKTNMTNLVTDLMGRPTEVLDIRSPYPYPTILVNYRTLEEPVIMGDISYALENSNFYKKGTMHQVENKQLHISLFEAVYQMSYQEELTQIDAYLNNQYTGYTREIPGGQYIRKGTHVSRYIDIPEGATQEQRTQILEKSRKSLERIFVKYQENMYRSKEEWKTIIDPELENINYQHVIDLVAVDPYYIPQEYDVRHIALDLYQKGYFTSAHSVNITIFSYWYSTKENGTLVSNGKTYTLPHDLQEGGQ